MSALRNVTAPTSTMSAVPSTSCVRNVVMTSLISSASAVPTAFITVTRPRRTTSTCLLVMIVELHEVDHALHDSVGIRDHEISACGSHLAPLTFEFSPRGDRKELQAFEIDDDAARFARPDLRHHARECSTVRHVELTAHEHRCVGMRETRADGRGIAH